MPKALHCPIFLLIYILASELQYINALNFQHEVQRFVQQEANQALSNWNAMGQNLQGNLVVDMPRQMKYFACDKNTDRQACMKGNDEVHWNSLMKSDTDPTFKGKYYKGELFRSDRRAPADAIRFKASDQVFLKSHEGEHPPKPISDQFQFNSWGEKVFTSTTDSTEAMERFSKKNIDFHHILHSISDDIDFGLGMRVEYKGYGSGSKIIYKDKAVTAAEKEVVTTGFQPSHFRIAGFWREPGVEEPREYRSEWKDLRTPHSKSTHPLNTVSAPDSLKTTALDNAFIQLKRMAQEIALLVVALKWHFFLRSMSEEKASQEAIKAAAKESAPATEQVAKTKSKFRGHKAVAEENIGDRAFEETIKAADQAIAQAENEVSEIERTGEKVGSETLEAASKQVAHAAEQTAGTATDLAQPGMKHLDSAAAKLRVLKGKFALAAGAIVAAGVAVVTAASSVLK